MCHLIASDIPPMVTIGYVSPLWIGPAITIVSPISSDQDRLKGQSPGGRHFEHASDGCRLRELAQVRLEIPSRRGGIREGQRVLAQLALGEDLAEATRETVAELLAGSASAGTGWNEKHLRRKVAGVQ